VLPSLFILKKVKQKLLHLCRTDDALCFEEQKIFCGVNLEKNRTRV